MKERKTVVEVVYVIPCAICNRTRRPLHNYETILNSMGYTNSAYAHSQCIIKVQQAALRFLGKLSQRKV